MRTDNGFRGTTTAPFTRIWWSGQSRPLSCTISILACRSRVLSAMVQKAGELPTEDGIGGPEKARSSWGTTEIWKYSSTNLPMLFARYSDQWNALTGDGGVWTGDRVNRIMKKFDGPDAVMHVDNITHFWPYGFIESRAMPYGTHIRHAIIVQAFYDDMTNLLCPDTSTRWNPDTNSCQDTNS